MSPRKIHNVLYQQDTRYIIKPNLYFEVVNVNNLLCFRTEDVNGQKKICIFHIPDNIICDYTLEFLLHKFISEMFLVRDLVTSAMKVKRGMAAQDLQKTE